MKRKVTVTIETSKDGLRCAQCRYIDGYGECYLFVDAEGKPKALVNDPEVMARSMRCKQCLRAEVTT